MFRFARYSLLLLSGFLLSGTLRCGSLLCAQQTVAKPALTPDPPAASQTQVTQQAPGVVTSPPSTTQTVQQTRDEKPADAQGEPRASSPASGFSIITMTAPGSVSGSISDKAPSPAVSSATYIIGPQDSLEVSVWKEPGVSGTFPVRPDGMISLSLIGEVKAAGMTPRQLADEVGVRLKKYLTDPSVNVVVLGVYPKQVYLLGEVAHVGALAITPEMTPLQAIAAAGGVTPFAKTKNIYILRGEQGKQQKIAFNYRKAIKDGNQQGVSLVPGDTIVVP